MLGFYGSLAYDCATHVANRMAATCVPSSRVALPSLALPLTLRLRNMETKIMRMLCDLEDNPGTSLVFFLSF